MSKYIVAIEETLVNEYEIEANDEKDALEIARKKYKECEIVLSPGEVQLKRMGIISPRNQLMKWIKF